MLICQEVLWLELFYSIFGFTQVFSGSKGNIQRLLLLNSNFLSILALEFSLCLSGFYGARAKRLEQVYKRLLLSEYKDTIEIQKTL